MIQKRTNHVQGQCHKRDRWRPCNPESRKTSPPKYQRKFLVVLYRCETGISEERKSLLTRKKPNTEDGKILLSPQGAAQGAVLVLPTEILVDGPILRWATKSNITDKAAVAKDEVDGEDGGDFEGV